MDQSLRGAGAATGGASQLVEIARLHTDRCKIWLPHDGDTQDRVLMFPTAPRLRGGVFCRGDTEPGQGRGNEPDRGSAQAVPRMRFDESRTEAGRKALGWYHEKRDEKRNIGLGPNHDWASHSGDAFGAGCIAYEEPQVQPAEPAQHYQAGGWMG